MGKHQGQTDSTHKVKLTSAISVVGWSAPAAVAGGMVGLEVFTSFVGNNAELKIELTDKTGKNHGSFTDVISANRFWAEIRVPPNASGELYATAKLPKHGLSLKSTPLTVLPAIEVRNMKWGQKEARRGDLVKLSADVKGAQDGAEATIDILEYDADGAHDRITKFTCLVTKGKVESEWEYEYHEDTDEIPTDEELKQYGNKYNPPEYFFTVTIGGEVFGKKQESGLLLFKDWIEIDLKDQAGNPIPDQDYVLKLPDGSTRQGKLDAKGTAREKDIPPGSYEVEFPKL